MTRADAASSDYAVASTVAGHVLDGKRLRSIGAMINHSERPNAKLVGRIRAGVDETSVVALRAIPRDEQICVAYRAAGDRTFAHAWLAGDATRHRALLVAGEEAQWPNVVRGGAARA